MPDPYRKIQVGDAWPFSATAYNGMVDAARAERDRLTGRTTGREPQLRNAGIVRVKNETGSDLGRLSVVGLDVPVFLPSDSEDTFLREVAFRGVTPATKHGQRFAVLLEPAPADRVVRAYVSGVFPVKVDLQDDQDTHAVAKDGETGHLVSCSGGGACQILWTEEEAYGYGSDTGVQWAVVRLGPSTETAFLAQLVSGVAARSGTTVHSATANVKLRSSGAIADDPDRTYITVWNLTDKTIASGAYVFVAWGSGDWWVVTPGSCSDLS